MTQVPTHAREHGQESVDEDGMAGWWGGMAGGSMAMESLSRLLRRDDHGDDEMKVWK